MNRTIVAVAMAVALVCGVAQAAFANSGIGTQCAAGETSCDVTAGTSGSDGGSSTPGSQGEGATGTGSGSSNGSGSGSNPAPSPTPTIVNGACTYQADPGYQPGPGVTPGKKPGAWYLMTCPDAVNSNNIATTTSQVVWMQDGTLPPALPAPAVLAAEAHKKLQLTVPTIESSPSPGKPQMVSVPMWAWMPESQFAAKSATAAVPGESVTATATPMSVTWSWGDGTSTTCSGPGTPYTSSDSASASSPTCGHTYTTDSGTGDFMLRATIIWNVTWVGGGQSGAFNGMTTTATEAVHVEQSRALVTGG